MIDHFDFMLGFWLGALAVIFVRQVRIAMVEHGELFDSPRPVEPK